MKELVEDIINRKLEGTHLFVTELVVKPRRIDIFLDGDTGVNIQECARINRYLHNQLEEKGIDTSEIHIDVSSSGIDRALESLREYKKNVGRKLQVKNHQNKFVKGDLVYADDKMVILSTGKKKEQLEYTQIKEAKVVI
jgi:ribosome maturation factor RimP